MDEEGREFLVGGGLVVHGQQTPQRRRGRRLALGIQPEPVDTVVVVASTLVEGGVGAVVAEGRCLRGQRVAQGIDDLGAVAFRHHHFVQGVLGHGLEAQLVHRVGRSLATSGGTAGQGRGAHGGTRQTGAPEELTAAQARLKHLLDVRVGGGVGIFDVEDVVRTGVLSGHSHASWVEQKTREASVNCVKPP